MPVFLYMGSIALLTLAGGAGMFYLAYDHGVSNILLLAFVHYYHWQVQRSLLYQW
jgi:hypothetical protein